MIRAYSYIQQYYNIYIWVSINDHPYCIHCGYLLFFEAQEWGTLLTWQWSRRQSLTPSTNRVSHRGSLLKGVTVQGVLYQSILNAKLTGRKKLGRKMCTNNRDDHKLENTVKQSRFKHLGELHKEWTEAGVSAIYSHHAQMSSRKGPPSHFWNRNIVRSILPGIRRKITGLLLSGSTCLLFISLLKHTSIQLLLPKGLYKQSQTYKTIEHTKINSK